MQTGMSSDPPSPAPVVQAYLLAKEAPAELARLQHEQALAQAQILAVPLPAGSQMQLPAWAKRKKPEHAAGSVQQYMDRNRALILDSNVSPDEQCSSDKEARVRSIAAYDDAARLPTPDRQRELVFA